MLSKQLNQNILQLKHNISFYKLIKKFFPRVVNKLPDEQKSDQNHINIKSKIKSTAVDKYLNIKSKSSKSSKIQIPGFSDDDKMNPKTEFDPLYEEYFMSRFTDSTLPIPEELQKMAKKVFSKHLAKDVREWTAKLMLRYSQTHATEAPTDLNIIPTTKLFANSEELDIATKIFSDLKREKKTKEEEENDNIIDVKEKQLNKDKEVFTKFRVIYDKAHVVAYLLCRMPFTLNVHVRLFTEISLRLPDFHPTSVLDFGSGLGSGIW